MTVHPDKALVKMLYEDRQKIFEKKITRDDGSVVPLILAIQQDSDMDGYSQQSVKVGIVMETGANIHWLKKGDRVLLDYTVDINNESVAYGETGKDKVVAIDVNTVYHQEDMITPANRNRPYDQCVWKKGEIDRPSMLIAVIAGEYVVPNKPYVILAYEKPKTGYAPHPNGIHVMEVEEIVSERSVIAAHPDSDINTGDKILVDTQSFFDMSADGTLISVVYDHDILCIKRQKSA